METMSLTKRFDEALVFAAEVHNGQLRKGTAIPYIAHLLSVTALVLENGGSEDEAVAALLHDAVEDCGVELKDISARFGPEVGCIVEACTDSFEKDPRKKAAWIVRKRNYLQRLAAEPRSVLLVSLSDKLHNSRAILEDYRIIGDKIWARFNASKEEILYYYESLLSIFQRMDCPGKLVDEFKRVVTEIEHLAHPEQASASAASAQTGRP
jgi:(p)ppGpp synthase/HD superfamily hydrolase